MTSQAKIDANRRNAQRSTGPRTEEGKAISARNALKHGLASPKLILFDETEDEFEDFYQALREAHAPADAGEAALVERIAVAHWRLRRVWRAEAATFNREAEATLNRRARDQLVGERAAKIEKKSIILDYEARRLANAEISDQAVAERVAADGPKSLEELAIWPQQLAELARYETALERQLHRLMLDLDRMQKARHRRIADQEADRQARQEAEDRALRARRAAEAERAERSQLLDGHPMAAIIRATNPKFADLDSGETKPNGAQNPLPAGERAG